MHLVVAGADLPFSVDDETAVGELAGVIECHKVIAPADMSAGNKDLRDRRASVRAFDHGLPLRTAVVDGDLLIRDALGIEQCLGPPTIRTKALGVDFNKRHEPSF